MNLSPPEARRGIETPPVVPWRDWYAEEYHQLEELMRKPGGQEGAHLLFVGPTRSGKTVLCRYLARFRNYVVVLGTKPKDSSLDAYVAEGYYRIDHWPFTRDDLRKGREVWAGGDVRFILWPKIRRREELRAFRATYARCLDDVFVQGNWTVVADEGIWLGSRKGLDLGDHLSDMAYGAASNGVSLYLLLQRPSGVPRIIWASVAEAEIFHGGVTNDVRELASLGTYSPRDVALAIQRLRGHEFLSLPTRGRAEWSISEVEMT